jgi:transcriptional/translational regulatory protein YebC/TACO1
MEKALEAGAEDVRVDGDNYEVITEAAEFETVKEALEQAGLALDVAEVTMLPKNMTPVDRETAEKVIRLVDALEDLDDVQTVYINADLPDDMEE